MATGKIFETDFQVVKVRTGGGAGAVHAYRGVMRKAQAVVQSALERLAPLGLTEDELRRVFENELAQSHQTKRLENGEGKS